MPRADPTRSTYCASRHLLRNLDRPAELRRNPLVRDYFAAADALERIGAAVQCALARAHEGGGGRGRPDPARMRAALLRCEIDRQPLATVAAELGLSERQLRRERRAAHTAFARAFTRGDAGEAQAVASADLATLRLTEAVELHELAQTPLALAALDAVARDAPRAERRIEALCLAAEVESDGADQERAAAHLDAARALLVLDSGELDAAALPAAEEQLDFAGWLLRWHGGGCGGIGAPPPAVYCARDAARAPDERRRALFVRACAAYATQRCETGDAVLAREALDRGAQVIPTLAPVRTKERLALAAADAKLAALRAPADAVRERLLALERDAARLGHVRTRLGARAERLGGEASPRERPGSVVATSLRPFGAFERRTMARTFAAAALIAARAEANPPAALRAAMLAEHAVAPRCVIALQARCLRAAVGAQLGRFDEARAVALAVRFDAERIGNHRLRGAAARHLAAIAHAQGRTGEARAHLREALLLLERYGTYRSLMRANALARTLAVG
ncbi:MAG: hypothetical protein JOZ86_10360 [Candidatus Eremiobacteraeota bacterium]|nr:hypothetical protein [Candidatus Eremiobacteraeota bacterium]